jgi:hypothetical protein
MKLLATIRRFFSAREGTKKADPMEQVAIQVYDAATAFFGRAMPRYGYKILYGPPYQNAPIMFIGYQPGGKGTEADRREDARWPSVLSYATESWPIARKMQAIWSKKFLAQCVGLNAIFVRAPSAAIYRKEFNGTREAIEKFCLGQVNTLVQAINPQKIVVIGLSTLDLFGGGQPVLRNAKGRVLVKEGVVAGRSAYAIMHLSGAQISKVDLNAIKAFIAVA